MVTNATAAGVEPSPAREVFSQASAIRAKTATLFDADVSGEWTLAGRPNGGYLLAFLGRAASELTDSHPVVAASAQFLRSPDPGPVEIEGEVLRRGRSLSQVRVRMTQDGRACLEALVSTSGVALATAPRWEADRPDDGHTPFADCRRADPITPDGLRVAMLDQVDLRLDPASYAVTKGHPGGRGELRGWVDLPGEEGLDSVSLLWAADAFPPATWDTHFGCWASTVELTVYVRAVPAPGPVRLVTRAELIDPQWVDQTCKIRDGTGRLVARATQLAKVLG
jgi:hypothetical protein